MAVDTSDKELTRAKNTAYRYLSFRPRTRIEVERKLREKEFNDSIVREVLSHLDRYGYLNDREFAVQWGRSRVRLRGFGRRRIEQELRDKGVAPDIVRETLAGIFQEAPEAETARVEANKKLKTLSRFEPEVRQRRIAGFLERKGFSSETIRSILREMKQHGFLLQDQE